MDIQHELSPIWLNVNNKIITQFLLSPACLVAVLLALYLQHYLVRSSKNSIPILNPKRPFELTAARVKRDFVLHGTKMQQKWFQANPDKPVRMHTDFGLVTMLPPHMTNEIRNDDRLSFGQWTKKTFQGHLPGFEGFREGSRDSGIVQEVIMKDLTKTLNKITEPLATETALATVEIFGNDSDWREMPLKDAILRLVARISCRVFLGKELCQNEAWLKITREYTIDAFMAAEELRMWPAASRPFVHWFLPRCRKLRAEVAEARRIMQPVLEQRQQMRADPKSSDQLPDDAIEWFEQTAKGRSYDPVSAQLILSIAAIHTTTDLLCQTLTELVQHPAMIAPLRSEMKEVLGQHGWKKTSLYQMKLLDSIVKESQRMKPIGTASMRRVALDNVQLSDGTRVSKHETLAVSSHSMWDSKVHENPGSWDGYRFEKMRADPSRQTAAQLVTTSPEHLAFGHGKHACPGRFFAANEIKIALIFLLLRYDWELPDGEVPKNRVSGFSLGADPSLKMKIRRRQDDAEWNFTG